MKAELVRAPGRVHHAGEFWHATLDSLTSHIAVLDEHGAIVAVNAAWRRFAHSQGGDSDYVGSNHAVVCESSADPLGRAAARGLREMLAGRREVFKLEYSCHSPAVQRWFLLRAMRYMGSGPLRVVVAHENITDRRQAQEQASPQAALLDETDVSVIVTDPDLNVVSWSAGAERLYGWTAHEAIGRSVHETVVPASRDSARTLRAITPTRRKRPPARRGGLTPRDRLRTPTNTRMGNRERSRGKLTCSGSPRPPRPTDTSAEIKHADPGPQASQITTLHKLSPRRGRRPGG
jgi:PAS domain-containing protein